MHLHDDEEIRDERIEAAGAQELLNKKFQPLPAQVTFGPLDPSEMNFFMGAWQESYRWAYYKYPASVYFAGMSKVIAAFGLTQRLLVARGVGLPEGKDALGFICYRERRADDPALVIHYVYVKREYRMQGLAKRLVTEAGWRGPSDKIIGSHKIRWRKEDRVKHRVFLNEFFAMAGHV